MLTYKALAVDTETTPIKQLFVGIGGTLLISSLREGILGYSGIIPKTFYIIQPLFGKLFAFSVWPTLWAIGYTSGINVAIPLVIGLISKYAIIAPLNYHSNYLPFSLFLPFDHITFGTAFCSGIVLCEVFIGIFKRPMVIVEKISMYFNELKSTLKNIRFPSALKIYQTKDDTIFIQRLSNFLGGIEPLLAVGSAGILMTYLGFSLIAQATLLVLVALATYEICFIGCEIGLIQFGRFSAFVLIPMIMLFKLSFIQMTAICVFFNICAAVASDTIFDKKTGSYCNLSWPRIHLAQWIGLITTSLCIGFILYLLFTHLTLGSEELFAQRGRTKALLIQSLHLNSVVVSLGFLYGLLLKRLKINPTMTLGGIIMPNNITIGIVFGGLISSLVKNKDNYIPICSGILATESLWIVVSLLFKFFS
jgi:hypothetical protein